MDTQTRHALKGDKFAQATKTSVTWLSGHRTSVVRWAIVAGTVVVVLLAALIVWNVRSSAANDALDEAMDAYNASLSEPGSKPLWGEYATAADRAQAANEKFVAVANKYSMLSEASRAHYFAGVTYEDLGKNQLAEQELKKAAGSWNRNLSNLAKLALAGLYRQTGRDAQAIAIYNGLIAKPSKTVPATMAQLDLADLYAATGKTEQARALWAKVKDSDKEGMAGEIASQRLGSGQ